CGERRGRRGGSVRENTSWRVNRRRRVRGGWILTERPRRVRSLAATYGFIEYKHARLVPGAATIRGMLALGSKPGGALARVDKGSYTVGGTASTTAAKKQRQTPAHTKPTPTRKKAPAAKAT